MKLRNPRSFIEPRAKSSFNIKDIVLVSTVLLIISFVLYFTFKSSNQHIKKSSQTQTFTSKTLTTQKISKHLPNHKKINLTLQKELSNLLSVVPYDMVLSSAYIKDGNSTISGEIIYKDSYYKEIKPKLLKLYEKSSADMYKTSDGTYEITIKNQKVKKIYLPKLIHKNYKISKNKTMNELKNSIKLLLPKNSLIHFKKEDSNEYYVKDSFKVSTYIHSPKEFYELIERINKRNECIVIENDLELNTYNSMIRINLIISIYQIINDKIL